MKTMPDVVGGQFDCALGADGIASGRAQRNPHMLRKIAMSSNAICDGPSFADGHAHMGAGQFDIGHGDWAMRIWSARVPGNMRKSKRMAPCRAKRDQGDADHVLLGNETFE